MQSERSWSQVFFFFCLLHPCHRGNVAKFGSQEFGRRKHLITWVRHKVFPVVWKPHTILARTTLPFTAVRKRDDFFSFLFLSVKQTTICSSIFRIKRGPHPWCSILREQKTAGCSCLISLFPFGKKEKYRGGILLTLSFTPASLACSRKGLLSMICAKFESKQERIWVGLRPHSNFSGWASLRG